MKSILRTAAIIFATSLSIHAASHAQVLGDKPREHTVYYPVDGDENDVWTIIDPVRPMGQINKAYAEMAPVQYTPAADRWENLPRTRQILKGNASELRVLMLGDSIVNDTSRSRWDNVLAAQYPKTKITKITVVRGGTGCTWYRKDGRVQHYVLPHKPDLLIIGGISHSNDIEAIKDVAQQAQAGSGCDVLLMTPAFGEANPLRNKNWSLTFDPEGNDFRAQMLRLSHERKWGFLDMTGPWGQYIRDSGKELDWFKRDFIHANERGEQIIGRILAAHLAPPTE